MNFVFFFVLVTALIKIANTPTGLTSQQRYLYLTERTAAALTSGKLGKSG